MKLAFIFSFRTETFVARHLRALILVTILALLAGPALAGYLWARSQERLGRAALSRGEFAEARQHFEQCLRIAFWNADLRLLAARAARMAGAYDVARGYLRDCQCYGGPADAIDVEYRLMRAQQGEFAEVEQGLVEDVLQGHPHSVTILEVLVPLYLRDYRLSEASECINCWLEREPGRVEAWLYRARIFEYLHQNDDVLESYRRVVELDPYNDEARLVLAGVLTSSNRPEQGLEHFEFLSGRLGNEARVLVGKACCLRALNRPDEARQLLDAALAANANNGKALTERARLAAQAESPAEAVQWFRKAVAAQPRDPDTNYGLYQALLRLGKKREAEQVRAQIDQIEADLDELQRLTKAVVTSPHDPGPRCGAGKVLLRTGLEEEALRWLASALAEDPRHAPTHQVLADYYERKGNLQQAHAHRRLAVSGP